MAFPSIRSQVTNNATANEATHTVSLPATIGAGDTILVLIRVTVAGAIGWPDASWIELFDASSDASDDQMAVAWRKADGSEGGTTISVTSGNGKFTSIAIAVQNATDPTLTPPTLGTVATGSATEPNPGNCNPAAGTKDYFWWTFYGMEGEQTGITAYPANYTLNQSGIVTTGAGGAVTTNCTMASAARQLAASSEDTGVWDVTGTLDDWTAYTIAFHPAEPVTELLPNGGKSMPSFFLTPMRSIILGTLTVNLLQSTLTPIEAPVFVSQTDVPQKSEQRRITHIDNTLQNTLDGQDENHYSSQMIFLRDIPGIRLTQINNLLQTTLKPEDVNPSLTQIYENPYRIGKGFIIADVTTFSQEVEETPFIPIEFPNPKLAEKIRQDWRQDRPQYYEDEYPSGKQIYDNPLLGKIGKGFTFSQKLDEPTDFPFIPVEFPNPKLKDRIREDWKNNNLQNTLKPEEITLPYNQYDWPNPLPTFTLNPIISITPPEIEVENPFNQSSWPNPKIGYRRQGIHNEHFEDITAITNTPIGRSSLITPLIKLRPNLGFASTYIFNYFGDTPTIPPNFPNPIRVRGNNQRGFEYRKQLEFNVGNPTTAIIYPNPLLKQRIRQDWIKPTPNGYVSPTGYSCIITLGIGAPGDIECFVLVGLSTNPQPFTGSSYYENPIYPVKRAQGFIHNRPFYYRDIFPSFPQLGNPIIPRFIQQGSVQSRPAYYVEPTEVPFKQVNWPNPNKKGYIITDVTTYTGEIPAIVSPFNQRDWPNPLQKRTHPKWEDFYNLDDTLPPVAQFTTNPLKKRRFTETWIHSPLVSSPTTFPPTGKQVFDNPLRKRRVAETWINQSFLSISAQPFRQFDYPNPKFIKYVLTHIQERPFYYTESTDNPIISPYQSNPLLGKRSHIDWIKSSKILEDEIQIRNSYSNPILKNRIAESHIVNLLQSTLEPAPGEIPIVPIAFDNPITKAFIRIDWIQDRKIYYQELNPFNNPVFANPIIKIIRQSWINQSRIVVDERIISNQALEIPVRKVIPARFDYTNVLTRGIILEPPRSSQVYEVPLIGKNRQLAFAEGKTQFITQDQLPFAKFIEFPVVKNRISIQSWIDNPIIILTTPEGEKPFAHTEAPARLNRIRFAVDILTIAGQNFIVLPQIKGRLICLVAAVDEFDLEAMLEEYDLNARFEEFNLEAGNEECE